MPKKKTETTGDAFLRELADDPETARREALADQAADLLDQIDALQRQIDSDGLVVQGSKGQPAAHPGLEMQRRLRLALARIVAQLEGAGGARAAGAALARRRWK